MLAEVEHPRPEGVPQEQYNLWLSSLSEAKFTYLVAAQVEGGGEEGRVGEGWAC